MDHLPLPQPPYSPHVPVVIRKNALYLYIYSPPFDTYPTRQGYDPAEFYDFATSNFSYPSSFKSAFASFAQSWLYFGVIVEFFARPFHFSDWTSREEDGVSVICTSQLCERVDLWRRDLLNVSEVERSSRERDLAYVLERAQYFLSVLSHGVDFTVAADFLPQDLLLSTQILYSTLKLALETMPEGLELKGVNSPVLEMLSERFCLNGWCASDVMRLRQDTSVLGEYYASRLGPLSCPREHGNCTAELCTASQIRMEEYKTQHLSPGCECEFVGLEPATLALHIMEDGKNIPLLCLNTGNNKILLQSATTEYVAISHVWADGLGNPHSNTLPLCQLIRIQNQVNQMFPRSEPNSAVNRLFWMDTICVPVGESFREQRSKAIGDMARIYTLASRVLIFNQELQEIESTRDLVELASRACRTSWFRRLWTLHEGVLSTDLYFQFRGAAISIDTMLDAANNDVASSPFRRQLERALIREACTPMAKIAAFRALPHAERIRHVWKAVQWRATSNADDETICLANMLGLDLSPILDIPRDAPNVTTERMKAFIREQRYFPASSLFESRKDPHGELARMAEKGYRWAPKSFVFRNVNPASEVVESPLAVADELGLHVQLPGLLMSWEDVTEGEDSLAFAVAGEWDYWYEASWLDEETRSWHVEEAMREGFLPAVIFEKDIVMSRGRGPGGGKGFVHELLMDGDMNAFSIQQFSDDCDGVFVLVKSDRGDTGRPSSIPGESLRGEIIGSVMVQKREFGTSTRPAREQTGVVAHTQKRQKKLLYFENLPCTQEWCIG